MKDKMKEKSNGPPDTISDAVEEFKKDPALSAMCENEQSGKNGEKGVNKSADRSYMDTKNEMGPHPDDIKEEEDLISTKIKPENVGDGPVLYPTDGNENMMMNVVPVGDGSGTAVAPNSSSVQGPGVQPLPSNVINKQPGTMEAQYMQQQSQIFVFSTSLANKAAESVLQGQFPSIIAYHCAQPGTKKYLEKHPLKLNQFNRHSPAQWLNNLAQLKQKPVFGGSSGVAPHNMVGKTLPPRNVADMPGAPGPRMLGPGSSAIDLDNLPDAHDVNHAREMHPDFPPINVWGQQGNMACAGPLRPMDRDKSCAGGRQQPMVDANFSSMSQFTLTGTKVPTENLTPQQRQHREEQLATLRKMQQMLFPENQSQTPDEYNNARMMNVANNAIDGQQNGNSNGRVVRPPMEVPLGSPMVNAANSVGGSPLMNPSNMVMGSDSVEPIPSSSPLPIQKMIVNNAAAQMEWHKLQQQFYEERKKKGRTESPAPRGGPHGKIGPGMSPIGGMGPQMQGGVQGNMGHVQGGMPPQMQGLNQIPGGTQGMQGPPPPYHQTARSASVPIAVPSPTPGSPSNATSNLSLPSPRTSSDLNSPSDVNKLVKMTTCSPPTAQGSPVCSKMVASNPDTPVSAVSASQSPTSSKELFSRNVGGLTNQKVTKPAGACSNKEPNLMPVPSPQQIQYLNAFEGQELTIQKQPNTSLKDTSTSSPIGHAQITDTPKCKTPTTANNNSPSQPPSGTDMSPRYQQMPQTNPSQQSSNPMTPHSVVSSAKEGNAVPSSPDNGPPGPSPCRSENLPLNPNGVSCSPSNKAVHFDPITSLAQMSQQLTSQAPPSCQGPPYPPNSLLPMDQGMHMETMDSLPFVPQQGPGMMDLPPGYIGNPSPKPSMPNPPVRCAAPPFFSGGQYPRMMGPNTYNGMNVQVKASTPNTIQYLPARPTNNSSSPSIRNPPSLDFLQRFANPGQDGKPPMFMGCHPAMEGPNPNMMLGGNMLGGNMMRGQLRPGMKPIPTGIGKPPGPGPVFDPMVMNNPGLYKGSPLGMPPDASQPLPPSMSQGNNFKNSPFVGPTVADPNYAQQFHNFQQQLYATNTRSQLNSHLSQSYFMPK